ncbi:MAG: hypothetical protein ACRCXZ_01690 [Patescibacteria group bacterium]
MLKYKKYSIIYNIMKGTIKGLKKKSKGPMSLRKRTKQISATKVITKVTHNKDEFICMLTPDLIEELREIKVSKNISYQDLLKSMVELYKKND